GIELTTETSRLLRASKRFPESASQTHVSSKEARLTIRRPREENTTVRILESCPCRWSNWASLEASQTRTVWSAEPLTMRRPSGENTTLTTSDSCPRRQSNSAPLEASQTRTVWSAEPLTMRRPSGENATLHTLDSCPRRRSNSVPLWASQTPIAPQRPTAQPPWTQSVALWGSQPPRGWSVELLTIRVPSGENDTLNTWRFGQCRGHR